MFHIKVALIYIETFKRQENVFMTLSQIIFELSAVNVAPKVTISFI